MSYNESICDSHYGAVDCSINIPIVSSEYLTILCTKLFASNMLTVSAADGLSYDISTIRDTFSPTLYVIAIPYTFSISIDQSFTLSIFDS